MQFFSWPVLIDGLLFFMPICAVFSLLGLFFVCIRYNSHSVSTAITVVIFCVLVWFIALPNALRLQDSVSASRLSDQKNSVYVDQLKTAMVTPDYFRPLGTSLVYYTKINESSQGTGVLILSDQDALFTNALIPFENLDILPNAQFGYRDPLIAHTAQLPSYITHGVAGYMSFLSELKHVSVDFFSKYGILLSFCVGFFSLWGLSLISSWRLLNAFFVLVGMSSFLYLNYCIFTVKLPTFLSVFTVNPVLLALVLNGSLFILANLWGFVTSNIRRKHYPRGEDN